MRGTVSWVKGQIASPIGRISGAQQQGGLVLLLVVFLITLASFIVINLTYSTFLGAQLNTEAERALQAEYFLKSAVNFARILIREDTSPEDAPQDPWGPFIDGIALPLDALGVKTPNVSAMLEIRPVEAGLPIKGLWPNTVHKCPAIHWRQAFVRLYRLLGFDDHQEPDTSGFFPNRVFNSEEIVAALIDYLDRDEESYDCPGFARGVEGDLPEGTFPNTGILSRFSELAAVPGYTPARLQELAKYTAAGAGTHVNVNLAPAIVLQSLHEEITPDQAQAIIAAREEMPFSSHMDMSERLGQILGAAVYEDLRRHLMIDVGSKMFQVIAKVDYGTASFFARAYIHKNSPGELPRVSSFELF